MIRTKIICTAGPPVDSAKKMEAMIREGASIIRLNCSHGTAETRLAYLRLIRKVEKKLGQPIGVMLDLQGPKLRIGVIPGTFELKKNDVWCLSLSKEANADKKEIPVTFKGLPEAVAKGSKIYMDDGFISGIVVKKSKDAIWIKIVNGGPLTSRKGINIPDHKGKIQALQKQDKEDVKWGLKHGVDFIALSFVRKEQDIHQLRALFADSRLKFDPLIIAKIEKPEAVENLDKIISVSDGIMVARGDLGVELPPERVPVIKKLIVDRCRFYQKPIIIATQMLDSMRFKAMPTRAEVSDVASQIYTSVDGIMLTGETSAGKYPVEATAMLRKVTEEVESQLEHKRFRRSPRDFGIESHAEIFLYNAMKMAENIKPKAIIMLTTYGILTKLLSKMHPKQPIYAISTGLLSERQLTLYWGLIPIVFKTANRDKRMTLTLEILKKKKVIQKGDQVVFIYRDDGGKNLNLKLVDV